MITIRALQGLTLASVARSPSSLNQVRDKRGQEERRVTRVFLTCGSTYTESTMTSNGLPVEVQSMNRSLQSHE